MSTAAPSPAAGGNSTSGGTTSTISVSTATGWHELKVEGYTRTRGEFAVGDGINSVPFAVGGRSWYIRYYPAGNVDKSAGYVSIYLYLADDDPGAAVRARYRFSLLDQAGDPVPAHTRASSYSLWSRDQSRRGYYRFISHAELEAPSSGYLRQSDDSFRVRCDVTVTREASAETTAAESLVAVPPPGLHRDLGALLDGGAGADVAFEVGGERFAAHRCVVAARSPVLMAGLFGPMVENRTPTVRIDGVEPRVFRALLRFIYTDSLPEVVGDGADEEDEERVGMAQHLLVAADRYGLARLKLMCEAALLRRVDASSAATTLTLAEQHGCRGLKEGCFRFLAAPGNMRAAMASDGFQHLRSSCPWLIEELLAKLAP